MKQNQCDRGTNTGISDEDLMNEMRKRNIYIAISIMTAMFLSLAALMICH